MTMKGIRRAVGDDVIAEWAALELAPWLALDLPYAEMEARLASAVASHPKMCLVRIENGQAKIDPEVARDRPYFLNPADPMGERALRYLDHLIEACATYGVTGSGRLALWLDDIYPDGWNAPVFCFQKRSGSRGILLPDIDFMNWRYYSDESDQLVDRTPFADKVDDAIFVGSTTGDVVLTADHVAERRNARLRSATRFRDSTRIRFHLPHIVQCDGPETELLVRELGVSGRFWTWPEQFAFRYLISMDGNGATCSRVVLGLAGNSVLLKYESPFTLYYFRGLRPWRHYVPILHDADIENLLSDSEAMQPAFAAIAAESTRFARTYLSRLSVLRYTAELVSRYLALGASDAGALPPRGDAALIDLLGHVAWRGSVWARPGDWLNTEPGVTIAPGSRSIEGIRLTSAVEIPPNDLTYSVLKKSGWTDPVHAGLFAGSIGESEALRGLVVTLAGESARRYDLRYQARFADGHETALCRSGTRIAHDTPLVDVRISIRRKRIPGWR